MAVGEQGGLPSPILNPPFDPPLRHYRIGPSGRTEEIVQGRRPSESFIPIAPARRGRNEARQTVIDLDLTGERRERNQLVNEIRRSVERWRLLDYNGASPTSKKLLRHWADPTRDNRVLFCQREAAETAIFLAEVAGRHGYPKWDQRISDHNTEHNAGLPRIALKMATGAGKTVVMAMLIAWQTANFVAGRGSSRYAKRFLVVTPGITIRNRLQVLRPGGPGNYYDERDLVPPDLVGAVAQAQIEIVNYHAFLPRDAKEVKGVSATTRKILLEGQSGDPFRETPEQMVSRVLRSLSGKGPLVVFNDEAHHCYRDRPAHAVDGPTSPMADDWETARVWFSGLQEIHKIHAIKTVYDLSATPFYLSGSGYNEGFIFPWVVSDFALMDAIESGIVKIPRVPVDDDATSEQLAYRRLWDNIGDKLPKRSARSWRVEQVPVLEGAIRSLYRSYCRSFAHWERVLKPHGEPPPVYIVICPNTVVSRLVYEHIAGVEPNEGALALFSNIVDGRPLARPRTVLIDSAQLESGDAMKADFKTAAAKEIEAFKADYRRLNPGADTEKLTDEDLLREVMNTVGKKGKLGEGVRCVVSVAMLTEGWDANTVTHILGIRAFGSQLLCEQVVGRGLRRRSYALDEDGCLEAEYTNVYGVPFAFIPSGHATKEVLPRPPAIVVESVPGREHLRIEFPKLDGYRVEIPDEPLIFDPAQAARLVIGPGTVPTTVALEGIAGESEEVVDRPADLREQRVAYELAKLVLNTRLTALGDDPAPWRFPQLVPICRGWLKANVDVAPGFTIGYLMASSQRWTEAADAIYNAITRQVGNRRERLRPMIRPFDPVGSTANVRFATRKVVEETEKSEVSHVTLDGLGGNTWEQLLANACERDRRVYSYAKNDHLGFEIPYVHQGVSHAYLPDFLVRLAPRPDGVTRTLIVEVSGGQKSPGPTKAKAATARDRWCVAVNNHGRFGRWGYIEIKTMKEVRKQLASAIDLLYADAPIVGDPDLLDYDEGADRAAS